MEQLSLFSATLGLSPPWQVTSVAFEKESNRLDICVEFTPGVSLTCPVCGRHGHLRAAEEDTETWYHADFFRYAAYLHARIPHLSCSCGTLLLERPWCRAGSRFAKVP
jgi:hypothetical protein